MQLDDASRGFSFQKKGPLDMRFNQKQKLTCKDVIEKFSEKEISTILWKFGEEKESRKIAKSIVKHREKNVINNTLDLAEIIKAAKTIKTKKHPATKSFQALRMAVNSEIENLGGAAPRTPPLHILWGLRSLKLSRFIFEEACSKINF